MNIKLQTLIFLLDGKRVLLGMKKRGFGAGRWNGFGGKTKADESILDAAHREIKEEAGIVVSDLKEVGVLSFTFSGQDDLLEVHVFTTTSWQGEPRETEEMRPEWFEVDELPFHSMWISDPYWLPLVLEGKKVKGAFYFKDQQHLASHYVEVI